MKQLRQSLLKRDIDVVKRRKIWYVIPGIIVTIAIIMGTVWGVTLGSPLNVAIDFVGGYAMTLRLSHRLTDDTITHYQDEIIRIAEELSSEPTTENPNPEPFGLVVLRREMMRQGYGEDASIYFRFRGVRSQDERSRDDFMEYVLERFAEELSRLFAFVPTATHAGGNTFTVVYNDNISFLLNEDRTAFAPRVLEGIVAQGEAEGITIEGTPTVNFNAATNVSTVSVTVANANAGNVSAVITALTIPERFSGTADHAGMTSAVMGRELLAFGLLMIALAFTLKLIYIAFRFDLASGTSAVAGLIHDLIMMFSFMVIFHIEIGVTFIAALITIMGYSLNNSFILFDRVKEKVKPYGSKEYDTKSIANKAAGETLFRSFATTVTGLFPIVAIAIIGFMGVPSIQIFAFPIIIGLISGTYSTLTILPTTWVSIKNAWFKRQKAKGLLVEKDQLLHEGEIIVEPAT